MINRVLNVQELFYFPGITSRYEGHFLISSSDPLLKEITMSFKFNGKKTGLFAAGVLFGTAGLKVLSSDDAKKFYTNCTAAVLRAKDSLMKTATTVQENAGDILAEAQQINEERAAKEAAEAEIVEETEENTGAEDFKEEEV